MRESYGYWMHAEIKARSWDKDTPQAANYDAQPDGILVSISC